MESSAKRKLLIGVSLLVVAGIGGYFAYGYFRKKRDEASKKKAADDLAAAAMKGAPAAEIPKNAVAPAKPIPQEMATVSKNPFKTSADVKKFQQWVIAVKNDAAILGSSGADGKWGKNTASAYSKYGNEYQATLTAKTSFNGMTVSRTFPKF